MTARATRDFDAAGNHRRPPGKGLGVSGVGKLVGAVAVVLGVWAVAPTASASSCDPNIELVWPKDGATLPVNGSVLFEETGCGWQGLGGWLHQDYDAFVDEELGTLEAGSDSRFGGFWWWPAPEPTVGSNVQLMLCGQDCDEAPPLVEFTLGPADDEAPSAPQLGELDYTLESFEDLLGDGELRHFRDWHLDVSGASADDPRVLRVVYDSQGAMPHTTWRWSDEATETITVRTSEEQAGQMVCMEVTALDPSGNASDPVERCRELSADETLDGDEAGCGCRVQRRGAWAWSGLSLLGLLGLRRRRRPMPMR